MSLKSQLRTLCIRTSALIHLNELALFLRSRGEPYGLVVEVHETPPSEKEHFRQQLLWAQQRFTIVDLDRFVKLWDGMPYVDGKPPLLFTFDDGRESNYTIAAPMLEEFGARGVFFVVPEFADSLEGSSLCYYRSRVNPNSKPGDEIWEDWKPMNAKQIADLAERGHAIGNHTLSHARLTDLSNGDLDREIGESARKISSWTGRPVDAFAWTFSWDAVDRESWEVIRRYHRYCFAPCPGAVYRHDVPTLIWRREIEVYYSREEFRFQYSGLADLVWAGRRRRLRQRLGIPA